MDGHGAVLSSIVISDDDKLIVTGSRDKLFDVGTLKMIRLVENQWNILEKFGSLPLALIAA